MTKTKRIAAVLALGLLASASVFGGGGQSNRRLDLTPLKKYDQPVRITVGRELNAGGQYAAGQTSENNGWTQLLKEALNIEIDVRNGFETPGGDYDQVLALRIASNNLPNTFGVSNSARGMLMFSQLVEGRRLADLTDIFPAAVGGMTKDYLNTLNLGELNQYMTVNNRLYGIHSGLEGYNTGLLWIRKDWLDRLGLQVPRTLDDIARVAQEFVRQRPGGQANTIGIALNPDIGGTGGIFGQWLGILPLFNAFDSYPDIWVREANGQIVHGAIQPQTKEALRLLAEWVRIGVLDRNMVTMRNGDEVRDTFISTNACGMYFQAWWDPWVQWDGLQNASVKNTQGIEWIPVMAPLNQAGKFSPKNESIALGGQVVSANFSNPEAVIKAMNLMEEVVKFRNPAYEPLRQRLIVPIEGQTDSRTNSPFRYGMATLMDRVMGAPIIREYLNTGRLNVTPLTQGIVDYMQGAYDWERNNTMAEWYRTRNDADADKYMFQYVGHGAFNLVMNMYLDNERSGLYQEKMPAYVGITDTQVDVGAMLDDLRNTTFMQIISGERPVDYFDTFVADWRRLGGDAVTAEVNAAARR